MVVHAKVVVWIISAVKRVFKSLKLWRLVLFSSSCACHQVPVAPVTLIRVCYKVAFKVRFDLIWKKCCWYNEIYRETMQLLWCRWEWGIFFLPVLLNYLYLRLYTQPCESSHPNYCPTCSPSTDYSTRIHSPNTEWSGSYHCTTVLK